MSNTYKPVDYFETDSGIPSNEFDELNQNQSDLRLDIWTDSIDLPTYGGTVTDPDITYDTQYVRYTGHGKICFSELVLETGTVTSKGDGSLIVRNALPFPASRKMVYQVYGNLFDSNENPQALITAAGSRDVRLNKYLGTDPNGLELTESTCNDLYLPTGSGRNELLFSIKYEVE